MRKIILKHFAPVAELQEKLRWVAYLADHYVCATLHDFYEEDKDSAWVDLASALNDPLVAAAVKDGAK